MVKLSKPFYVISTVGAGAVSFLLANAVGWGALSVVHKYRYEPREILETVVGIALLAVAAATVISVIILIYVTVVWLVLWFKAWKAISEPTLKPKPLATVLLLLVPVFSWFWGFRVYWGWSKKYNDLVFEKNRPELAVNENTFLAFSVANAAFLVFLAGVSLYSNFGEPLGTAFFPFICVLTVVELALLSFTWYIVKEVCDAVNRLPASAANTSAPSRTR